MLKRLVFVLALSMTALSLSSPVMAHHNANHQNGGGNGNGNGNNPVVQAVVNPYTYFCHRGNAVKNPYQAVPFSNTYSEVDGQGNNDHTQHTGPIATSPEIAQALKNDKINWGDIIPPVPNVLPNGYNWTAEGQAIWAAGCDYAAPDFDQPLITFDVSCTVVNGALKNVVTLTNEGDASGSAFVNGEEIVVAANGSDSRAFDSGVNIEVVIDGQTEYNAAPLCDGGRGAGDPGTSTTTTVAQVDAPVNGVNAGGGSAIASLLGLSGSLGSVAFGVRRLRKQ